MQEGTATNLGRFTAVQTERVDLATSAATGTYTFTAADGDQLVATTVSQGEPTSVENVAIINGTWMVHGLKPEPVRVRSTMILRRDPEGWRYVAARFMAALPS